MNLYLHPQKYCQNWHATLCEVRPGTLRWIPCLTYILLSYNYKRKKIHQSCLSAVRPTFACLSLRSLLWCQLISPWGSRNYCTRWVPRKWHHKWGIKTVKFPLLVTDHFTWLMASLPGPPTGAIISANPGWFCMSHVIWKHREVETFFHEIIPLIHSVQYAFLMKGFLFDLDWYSCTSCALHWPVHCTVSHDFC